MLLDQNDNLSMACDLLHFKHNRPNDACLGGNVMSRGDRLAN
jgi:hypothetical protein